MMWKSFVTAGGCFFLGTSIMFAQAAKPEQPPQRSGPAQLFERQDKNKDGFLQKDEIPRRLQARFAKMDINNDGKISRAELQKAAGGNRGAGNIAGLFRRFDTNKDGKLTKDELKNAPQALRKLDRNKDGTIDRREARAGQRPGRSSRPGEVNTPPARGERRQTNLKVGDMAPDFTLPDLTGKNEITLSSFRGKKPVVLIFASYT